MTSPDKSESALLNERAIGHLKHQELKQAKVLLQQATALDPSYLPAWTNLAGVLRNLSEYDAALAAVDGALRIEPRAFFALFFRATIIEQLGDRIAAANAYEIALQVAPPVQAQDDATKAALQKATIMVSDVAREKEGFLRDRLAPLLKGLDGPARARSDILIGNVTGLRKPFVQQPLVFNYPYLPAIEFWDRGEMEWIDEIERATPDIISELRGVLQKDQAGLTPYIRYGEGLPIDQWADLNHNPDWSAYHLIEAGQVVQSHAQKCPKTMAALAKVPFPTLPGRSPVALFSVLQPHTHIPPHTGASNARLLCHLPLIVPEGCRYRVGGSWREWEVGKAFVFDDTIEHEAFNDSDQIRVVLIFDIWNPRLSEVDREIISQTTHALDQINGTAGKRHDWT